MSAFALETRSLTKQIPGGYALQDVSLQLEEGRVYGLLGRNGAGKSTLLQLVSGLVFPSAGSCRVFGEDPLENPAVLSRMCFVQESAKYPETFKAKEILALAAGVYPNWDQELASRLIEAFRVPLKTTVKKLSRGQHSAIGVVIGLAARAPLTIFDEPYIGLDASARQLFYDSLLQDLAICPRTVLLSTHHIDEAANLLESVIILREGRLLIHEDTDTLRERALTLSGPSDGMERFLARHAPLRTDRLGRHMTASVFIPPEDSLPTAHDDAQLNGLFYAPLGLQDLVVGLTEPALPRKDS